MRALAIAFALCAGCNLIVGFDQPAERGAQCSDGVDNDGNGRRDCEETACGDEPICAAICGAGIPADLRSLDPESGHCYLGYTTERDVVAAHESCLALGGYLAVPDGTVEDGIIRAAAPGAASLGFQDTTANGVYDFVMVTGDRRVEYTNFSAGQPDAPPYADICVSYDGDAPTWQDHDCLSLRPYVCELEPDACGDFVRQPAEECDDGNDLDDDGCTSACVDVDECAAGTDTCSPDADCTNEPWRRGALGYSCQCRSGFVGDGFTCTALPAQPVFTEGEPTRVSATLESCTTQGPHLGRKLAMDPFGALYAVMMCGGEVHATASVDGGLTWSAPQLLATQVEQVAVVGIAPGRAAVATWQSDSLIMIRQTRDFGATWSAVGTVTFASGGLPALSLATDGATVFVGEVTFDGVLNVHRSLDADLQNFAFAPTVGAIDGDVLVDPAAPGQVWAAAAAPGYQLMVSDDGGQTFPGPVTLPTGSQDRSDWAIGGGVIAVTGGTDQVSTMQVSSVGTASTVTGLPPAAFGQRSIAVDPLGAVIVAQASAAGGAEVVRLPPGGQAFDPAVGVDFVGTDPHVVAVPGGLVAVLFAGGGSIHVAIIDP